MNQVIVLSEVAESLKIYADRTGQEDEDSESEKASPKVEKAVKKPPVENDNFDMKTVMSNFIDEMLVYLVTQKSAASLGLAPDLPEELDSDDELPPQFQKAIPKSQKREKAWFWIFFKQDLAIEY